VQGQIQAGNRLEHIGLFLRCAILNTQENRIVAAVSRNRLPAHLSRGLAGTLGVTLSRCVQGNCKTNWRNFHKLSELTFFVESEVLLALLSLGMPAQFLQWISAPVTVPKLFPLNNL
jgi:hypothetical protein